MQAKLSLDQTRGQQEIPFDDVEVKTDGNEQIEFVLSNGQGDRVRLSVSRAKLKDLVSWRLLMSL